MNVKWTTILGAIIGALVGVSINYLLQIDGGKSVGVYIACTALGAVIGLKADVE
jgi:uncharacterized membrane protein YeaQ/YmgE (transglycosylase-associated protein family)